MNLKEDEMARKENIEDLSEKITDPVIMGEDVSIVMITSSTVPTQMGGIGVMILGLGSDDKVYRYNGAKQNWQLQK